MDVERTSLPRIRRGIGDGLGCYDFAPRETALSELVARPRICTFCHNRRGAMPLCCIQRQAVLMDGARRSTKGFKHLRWPNKLAREGKMSLHFSRRKFLDGAGVLATSAVLAPSTLRFGSVRVGEPMKPEELRAKLRGVIAFPITPLQPDLSLDIPGLRKNLQRLMENATCCHRRRRRDRRNVFAHSCGAFRSGKGHRRGSARPDSGHRKRRIQLADSDRVCPASGADGRGCHPGVATLLSKRR